VSPFPTLAPERARALVESLRGRRVLVLGDVMVDQFIVGRVNRISPEAPVPVVTFDRDEYRAGGAANVALNIKALGASVDLIGLVGADAAAARLTEQLHAADVRATSLVTDQARRTTTKVRIVTTRNQQVARVDYESDDPASETIERALIDQLESHASIANAIVISDYMKGIVTRRVMAAVVAAAQQHGLPVLVDPKIPHLDYYAGATIVTPNHVEAETATHMRIRTEQEARRAAAVFRERTGCDGVLITRGEQGMWLTCDNVEGHLPATAREVSDVTGAGDTVVATLALAVAAGASIPEAARLANQAAGIAVGKFGPATVTADELLNAVLRANLQS
jgi:D-beta-D-heptose 7-phosphate kinase/D-beta-D-heptose 1-phosphate adenosyltransferase